MDALVKTAIFKTGTPSSPALTTIKPLSSSSTEITLSAALPISDAELAKVTGVAIAITAATSQRNTKPGFSEVVYAPIANVSADKTKITGLTRGIKADGSGITSDSSLIGDHPAQSNVTCVVLVQTMNQIFEIFDGLRSTGGNSFYIGDGTDTDRIMGVNDDVGENGIFKIEKIDATNNKIYYSTDRGVSWSDLTSAASHGTTASLSSHADVASTVSGSPANNEVLKYDSTTSEYKNIATDGTEEPFIKTPTTYTPAYMTGGTSPETSIVLWDSVSDGSFRVTIDGTAYNVDGIDFTATGALGIVTSMADVASVIQYHVRALTSSLETVVWSTDHFVVSSVDTSASSAVSVFSTSTGTVGTDISGAGASNWTDCDVGTLTSNVLDQTQDVNKVPVLNSSGKLDTKFHDISEEVFTDLSDTPTSYTGNGGKLLAVNSTEDAVEFLGVLGNSATFAQTCGAYKAVAIPKTTSSTVMAEQLSSNTVEVMDGTTQIKGQNFYQKGFNRIVSIAPYMKSTGSPPGYTTIDIFELDTAGKPTGAAVGSVSRVSAGIPTTVDYQVFTFSTEVVLDMDTRYGYYIRVDGGDGSNYIEVYPNNTSNNYDPQEVSSQYKCKIYSNDTGATWTLYTAGDYRFQLYGRYEADGKVVLADASTDIEGVVGLTDSTVSPGTGTYYHTGVLGGFSGLAIGNTYYVQNVAGEIGSIPGITNLPVGLAISETELQIQL